MLRLLGHSYTEGNGDKVIQWLYSFHMPLFFITSGIVKRFAKEKRFGTLIKERAKGLLVPYFVWGCIAAVVLMLLGKRPFSFLLNSIGSILALTGLSAMWFLPCMFISEMLVWIVLRLHKRNKWHGALLTGVLLLFGVMISTDNTRFIVLLRSFTGATFIYFGYLLAAAYSKKQNIFVWLLVAACHIGICYSNDTISIASRQYGNVLLFYANGLIGTWVVIQFHDYLMGPILNKISQAISWIGKNSLVVVCTSLYPIELIRIVDYKITKNALPNLGIWEGMVICLIAVMIETGIILFCNKYLYFLFGRRYPVELRKECQRR